MEKLIITLAPTGNVPTKAMTPHVPVTADEIAADIIACCKKGASVAHIHARDEAELPTTELKYFADIVQRLDAADCPIVKQISTGARGGKSGEARCEALVLNPESASLATGSSNFPASVNANDPKLVETMAKIMLERKIKPEIEVFDWAMISFSWSRACRPGRSGVFRLSDRSMWRCRPSRLRSAGTCGSASRTTSTCPRGYWPPTCRWSKGLSRLPGRSDGTLQHPTMSRGFGPAIDPHFQGGALADAE